MKDNYYYNYYREKAHRDEFVATLKMLLDIQLELIKKIYWSHYFK